MSLVIHTSAALEKFRWCGWTWRVPTIIANQVLALDGNVLRDFGKEIQGAEDLEVTFRSAAQVGAGRAKLMPKRKPLPVCGKDL